MIKLFSYSFLLFASLSHRRNALVASVRVSGNHSVLDAVPRIMPVRTRALKKGCANIDFRDIHPPSGSSVAAQSDQIFSAVLQDLDGHGIKSAKLKYKRDGQESKKYRSVKLKPVGGSRWQAELSGLESGTYRWLITAKSKKAHARSDEDSGAPFVLYVSSKCFR